MKKFFVFLTLILLFIIFPGKISAINTPHQGNSSYTTPSGDAPSDGTSTETVSVHLRDINQNPVIGDMIQISSSNDSTASFPKNNQVTDENGNASFTVATNTPGTVKITITDLANSVAFSDWFTINFYSSKLGCANIPPSPKLVSVVSKTDTTATLTWNLAPDPVNNYLVSYGTESKKYIYGNPNVGGQGTNTFTVGNLPQNKKYYFVVAANNNCGRGGFSNEMSVFVGTLKATAKPPVSQTAAPTPKAAQTVKPDTAIRATLQPTLPGISSEFPKKPVQKNILTGYAIASISAGSLLVVLSVIFLLLKR